MRSTYYILIEPLNGELYSNSSSSGLILNASIEDFKSTQRLGKVVGVPSAIHCDIKVGDIVVVHHNIFRTNYDMRGRMRNSSYMIERGLYYVEPERVYMIFRDGEWSSFGDFVFVSPVKRVVNGYSSSTSSLSELIGEVSMIGAESIGVSIGDRVTFKKDSEYEFRINDSIHYRIPVKNIVAVL